MCEGSGIGPRTPEILNEGEERGHEPVLLIRASDLSNFDICRPLSSAAPRMSEIPHEVASRGSEVNRGVLRALLQGLAPFQSPGEGDIVGVLELTPEGKTTGNPGDRDAEGRNDPVQVHGGLFALQVGVGG